MLKTRVITALWLVPLAFLVVFGLPERGFELALAAILLLGAWEFGRLAGLGNGPATWALIGLQTAILAWLYLNPEVWRPVIHWVLTGACLAWLLMLLRLVGYRPGQAVDGRFRFLGFCCALIVLSAAWIALGWLRSQPQGSWWILALLLVVWAADTGAYFSGRTLGKRKLAPKLSPGKTRAGLAGGLLAAAVVGWAAITWLPTGAGKAAWWLVMAAVTALVSVGGDLFISMHKRVCGLKDSGHVFPGHGGILDRLDSLLAGAPFFALGLWLWSAR